ncbi:MAG: metallophosphoesterase, partial [Acidobacteriota bacterium]
MRDAVVEKCPPRLLRAFLLRSIAVSVVILPLGQSAVDAAVEFFRSPYLQRVTERSVTICWETTVLATGAVVYREKGSEETLVAEVGSSLRQEVVVSELREGTTYDYEVRSPSEAPEVSFTASFRTAPVEDVAFTFVVYGDSRHEDDAHREVVAAIRSVRPAFIIHLGDIVDAGGSEYGWNMFWPIVAPLGDSQGLAANVPIFPVLGNHEYHNGAQGGFEQPYSEQAVSVYQANFALPSNGLEEEHPEWSERFYSFRYGPALFVVLDVNNDSDPQYDTNYELDSPGPPDIHPGSPQYKWMVEQLRIGKRECAFTFVCLHHAPYSSGPSGNPNNPFSGYRLRFLDEVFRRYGVDMVFSSHDHFYERCETRNNEYPIVYFVSGAGGAPRYLQRHDRLAA